MRKVKIFSVVFLLAGAPSLALAADLYGLSDDDSHAIQEAFGALFNDDFSQADQLLSPLKSRAKKHPLVQTAFVVRYWWEMASQVLETDAEASKPFIAAAEENLTIVEKSKKTNTETWLSWATTLGLMSRWSAANRAWVPAYFRGNKAGEYARRALKADERAADAYMTLGAVVYGKERIRQFLSPTEKQENPDDPTPPIVGLSLLQTAYKEGIYFKTPAGLLLTGIYTNEKPEEAIPLLRQLKADVPRSGFIHMLLLTALYNAGQEDALVLEIDEFEKQLKERAYSARYQPQLDFAKGLVEFRKKEWKNAEQIFQAAAQSEDIKNPYVIWAHLYRGYALDAAKKREMAKGQYRKVLSLPRRFASHDHARARLEKPFRATDPELKKLEL